MATSFRVNPDRLRKIDDGQWFVGFGSYYLDQSDLKFGAKKDGDELVPADVGIDDIVSVSTAVDVGTDKGFAITKETTAPGNAQAHGTDVPNKTDDDKGVYKDPCSIETIARPEFWAAAPFWKHERGALISALGTNGFTQLIIKNNKDGFNDNPFDAASAKKFKPSFSVKKFSTTTDSNYDAQDEGNKNSQRGSYGLLQGTALAKADIEGFDDYEGADDAAKLKTAVNAALKEQLLNFYQGGFGSGISSFVLFAQHWATASDVAVEQLKYNLKYPQHTPFRNNLGEGAADGDYGAKK